MRAGHDHREVPPAPPSRQHHPRRDEQSRRGPQAEPEPSLTNLPCIVYTYVYTSWLTRVMDEVRAEAMTRPKCAFNGKRGSYADRKITQSRQFGDGDAACRRAGEI